MGGGTFVVLCYLSIGIILAAISFCLYKVERKDWPAMAVGFLLLIVAWPYMLLTAKPIENE